MKLQLPLEPTHPLVRWANSIRGFYGHPVYLVGSQLTDKPDPRDVDVICVIPNDEFTLRFGDVYKWLDEGGTGQWTDVRWRWSDHCVKKWKQGCLETGLNLDFKVIPMCAHIGEYGDHPTHRLDTRNDDFELKRVLSEIAFPVEYRPDGIILDASNKAICFMRTSDAFGEELARLINMLNPQRDV